MASKQSTVDFILDQLSDAGEVSAKKMFGDYGVFLSEKMIALICDDKLFFKPTEQGRKHLQSEVEGIPYPGAKPCFLIPEDQWDDREWLSEMAVATFNGLPFPKIKSKKKKQQA